MQVVSLVIFNRNSLSTYGICNRKRCFDKNLSSNWEAFYFSLAKVEQGLQANILALNPPFNGRGPSQMTCSMGTQRMLLCTTVPGEVECLFMHYLLR